MSRRQQPRLDAGHLGEGRHAKPSDLLGFERPRAAKLADARENAVELSEDQDRPLHALGLPAGDGLERRQDLVEAITQVLQHVITVHADRVARGGRAADEDGSGNQVLEVPLRREQPFPVRKLVDGCHDGRIVPRDVVPTNRTIIE